MKKNKYVVPAIEVVDVQEATALLLGSDVYTDPANSSLDVLSREAEFSDEMLNVDEF